jgi:hypothetical protein
MLLIRKSWLIRELMMLKGQKGQVLQHSRRIRV